MADEGTMIADLAGMGLVQLGLIAAAIAAGIFLGWTLARIIWGFLVTIWNQLWHAVTHPRDVLKRDKKEPPP